MIIRVLEQCLSAVLWALVSVLGRHEMNIFPPLGVWLNELRNDQECAELGKKEKKKKVCIETAGGRRVKWSNALSSAWLSYVSRRGAHFTPSYFHHLHLHLPLVVTRAPPRASSRERTWTTVRAAAAAGKGEEDLGVNYGVWRRRRLGGGGGGCGRRLSDCEKWVCVICYKLWSESRLTVCCWPTQRRKRFKSLVHWTLSCCLHSYFGFEPTSRHTDESFPVF